MVCGPDDIAREICRHCATAELREGNAAVALTSPCYNGVRSLFVVGRSPFLSSSSRGSALFHFDVGQQEHQQQQPVARCRVVETITALNALRSMDFAEIR